MKLYIAGPMAGYPEHNHPAFFAAEEALEKAGHFTYNPVRLVKGRPEWGWADWLRADIGTALLPAEGVAVLDGWQASKGATLEVHIAHALAMPVMPVQVWIDPNNEYR